MLFRRRLRTSALLACLATAWVVPARAQAPDPNATPNATNVAAARRHFDRARGEYAQGAYREAIAELEAAHSLDPTAKDLVFNLGVVHEKLSDIDEALKWFQLYTTMDVTPTERERADSYMRRLEGAKKELTQKRTATSPATSGPVGPPQPEPVPTWPTPPVAVSTPHGRIDAATIVAAGVAAAALGFGTVMGLKARAEKPPSGFVTGQDGLYSALQNRTNIAYREAILADVGFGTSVAAGITAAILFAVRTRDPHPHPTAARVPSVSAAPLRGGAALFVQGCL